MLTLFGFYTNDGLYTKQAEILKASAERLNISIDLRVYDKNQWQKIIAFKPTFIAKMRKELKGKILFIDADAIILEDIRPYFENITEDIGVHYLSNRELLSGTIFINDTPNAHALINEWEIRQMQQPEVWDQKILQTLIDDWVALDKISIKKTSERYTYIFDISKKIYGDSVTPAIEHLQASCDTAWVRKYNSKSKIARFFMRSSLFSKATRKLKPRHNVVNNRTKQLDIDLQISVKDLIQ